MPTSASCQGALPHPWLCGMCMGRGGVRAAAVGADASFLHHSGAKETDVSHQESHKVQLGARMNCFCLCFATVLLTCQQPATFPQFNTCFSQLYASRAGARE